MFQIHSFVSQINLDFMMSIEILSLALPAIAISHYCKAQLWRFRLSLVPKCLQFTKDND